MTLLREHNTYSPSQSQEFRTRPKVFLGSYMPFAGVKMYTLLNEHDLAQGNTKIGPVGWRAAKQPLDEEAPIPEWELVLA